MEVEAKALGKKKLVWDNIDIVILENVGYKLEYISQTNKGR